MGRFGMPGHRRNPVFGLSRRSRSRALGPRRVVGNGAGLGESAAKCRLPPPGCAFRATYRARNSATTMGAESEGEIAGTLPLLAIAFTVSGFVLIGMSWLERRRDVLHGNYIEGRRRSGNDGKPWRVTSLSGPMVTSGVYMCCCNKVDRCVFLQRSMV